MSSSRSWRRVSFLDTTAPILEGPTNWFYWNAYIEDILKIDDYWEAIETLLHTPATVQVSDTTAPILAELMVMDKKVHKALMGCIDETPYMLVAGSKSAGEVLTRSRHAYTDQKDHSLIKAGEQTRSNKLVKLAERNNSRTSQHDRSDRAVTKQQDPKKRK